MARARNWDKAKRREWKAEAKREKAIERRHEAIARQAEWERRRNEPATERQIGLIRKWKMHEHYGLGEDFLATLVKKDASALIDRYAKEHNWKESPKTKAYRQSKRQAAKNLDTSTYKPWMSSDIKVTNLKTGETFVEKNRQNN